MEKARIAFDPIVAEKNTAYKMVAGDYQGRPLPQPRPLPLPLPLPLLGTASTTTLFIYGESRGASKGKIQNGKSQTNVRCWPK